MIGNFLMEFGLKEKFTVHLKAMGIALNTTYKVLRRFEKGVVTKRKSGSGRPDVKMKISSKVLSRPKKQPEFLGETYFLHQDQQIL